MQVTNFDKPTIKAIRLAMDSALAQVEKDYGIKISTGNARFSGNEVTFKVKANTVTSDGVANTKEADNWELYKNTIGLGWLNVGDQIMLQGKYFTLKGYNTRARKSPIQIEDMQGRGISVPWRWLKCIISKPCHTSRKTK